LAWVSIAMAAASSSSCRASNEIRPSTMSVARLRPYFILAADRPTERSCSSLIARKSAGCIDGTAASSRSQMLRAAWTETCWPTIDRISPPKPVGNVAQLGMAGLVEGPRDVGIGGRQFTQCLLEGLLVEDDRRCRFGHCAPAIARGEGAL
jgi:hypothetical protein